MPTANLAAGVTVDKLTTSIVYTLNEGEMGGPGGGACFLHCTHTCLYWMIDWLASVISIAHKKKIWLNRTKTTELHTVSWSFSFFFSQAPNK